MAGEILQPTPKEIQNRPLTVVALDIGGNYGFFTGEAPPPSTLAITYTNDPKEAVMLKKTREFLLVNKFSFLPLREELSNASPTNSAMLPPSTIVILPAEAARDSDKVRFLELGADHVQDDAQDVNTLRGHMLAIRNRRETKPKPRAVHHVGNLTIDLEARTIRQNGELFQLSILQYRLLMGLARNAGKVLSEADLKDMLMKDTEGHKLELRTVITGVRKRLHRNNEDPQLIIKEIPGKGYTLGDEPQNGRSSTSEDASEEGIK